MGPTAHVLLTTNASDRQRERVREEVETAARAAGWVVGETSIDALAGRTSAVERLIVCGGDGLVHRCLPLVAGSGIDVAIVPVGTGNDFARAFGIDRSNAVEVATSPDRIARPVDLVKADCDATGVAWAASVVTGGYSGRVTDTANGLRFPPGSSKYTAAALLEIGRLSGRPTRLVVTADDGDETVIDGDLALYAVANTAWFGGGMQILPDADPTDGLLDVLTIDDVPRRTFAAWLPRVFRGTHVDHPAVRTARGHSVRIETDEHVWADGEPLCPAPVTLTAAPGALRLLTP